MVKGKIERFDATAFLQILLLLSINNAVASSPAGQKAEKSAQAATSLKNFALTTSSSKANVCSFAAFFESPPHTPRVDAALISSHIKADGEVNKKITHLIQTISNIDPEVRFFVDFVITHSPDFIIFPVDEMQYNNQLLNEIIFEPQKTSLSTVTESGAFYCYRSNLLFIPIKQKYTDTEIKLFLHELIHVAMDVAHEVLTGKASISYEPYHPLTAEKARQIEEKIKNGDTYVKKLSILLVKEFEQQLTSLEKKELAKIRAWGEIYLKGYADNAKEMINISLDDFLAIEKLVKHPVQIGDKINIDNIFLDRKIGSIEIIEINKDGQNVSMLYKILDPVSGIISIINGIKNVLSSKYPEYLHTAEFIAYLFQCLPVPLIKIVYKKYFEEAKNMVLMASKELAAHTYSGINLERVSSDPVVAFENDIYSTFIHDGFFDKRDVKNYQELFSSYLSTGNTVKAGGVQQSLSKHGYNTAFLEKQLKYHQDLQREPQHEKRPKNQLRR